ncbi:flagellar basal-body MS-ring/collar protein FliF [Pontibacillus litoralis]|uniref:Flagellar M-ring protein n=1 Tax=Pontibacillus litoralis JSM 072002 TaxID=1385512 RepID=A0A0A5G5Q8_9BACI|nr:flagellar basal-body MS-ring/collar protein FliF [Pontibacillus litoralis]KGX88451.1 flagellar M-ring protein FliF [Pontibacillus litoralis JSM 072002]
MREKLQQYKNDVLNVWKSRTLAQKSVIIGAMVAFFMVLISVIVISSKPNMTPLYSNLSHAEVGQIKEELDTRGIQYDIANSGQTILVPEEQVDALLVDLAAQGLPNTGNIDYSYFSENASWGMSSNEFEVIKLDAMQSELSHLISSIDGISDANVMINKPEETVFVGEDAEKASASVVIHKEPGYELNQEQVQALYNLVSKSVPDLPTDNIVITDQNFNHYDVKNDSSYASGDSYDYQQNVKADIEKDIQQRVQQMLGMMIGQDKVMVSVTADVDFTKENRTEQLVEPVSEDEAGLPVSVERITETYTGENATAGGTPGTGEGDIPNYNAGDQNGDGEYEMMKETINNEYNQIQKNIVESPYKVRDLGIQVAVNNAKQTSEGEQTETLTPQEQATVEEGITSILTSIVETSVSKEYGEVNPEENISIVFQAFNGKPEAPNTSGSIIPTWVYAVGGILLVVIATLIWMLVRKKDNTEQVEEYIEEQPQFMIPDIDQGEETESSIRRKQLERMAKDKPEDFAKLLRSWIAED